MHDFLDLINSVPSEEKMNDIIDKVYDIQELLEDEEHLYGYLILIKALAIHIDKIKGEAEDIKSVSKETYPGYA